LVTLVHPRLSKNANLTSFLNIQLQINKLKLKTNFSAIESEDSEALQDSEAMNKRFEQSNS